MVGGRENGSTPSSTMRGEMEPLVKQGILLCVLSDHQNSSQTSMKNTCPLAASGVS